MEKQIMFFETRNVIAGITTSAWGNMRYYGNISFEQIKFAEKQMSRISLMFGVKNFIRINPEGKTSIVELKFYCDSDFPKVRYHCGEILFDSLIFHSSVVVPKIMLAVPTGDCPVVILYDEDSISAIHSGWRGTEGNIVGHTARVMKKYDNCDITKVKAIIWPGICGNCYKVKDDVGLKFPDYTINGKLSLSLVIKDQLKKVGILESNMNIISICPHCSVDNDGKRIFFSHRHGESERNLVFVMFK